MNVEQSALLRAVGDVLRERGSVSDALRDALAELPAPSVTNDVAAPVVHVKVDMTPVAEALEKALDFRKEQSAMLRAVGDVVRESKDLPPVPLHVVNEIPQAAVSVSVDMAPVAAALDRLAAAQTANTDKLSKLFLLLSARPERPKRRVVISYDDGTKTVISEE